MIPACTFLRRALPTSPNIFFSSCFAVRNWVVLRTALIFAPGSTTDEAKARLAILTSMTWYPQRLCTTRAADPARCCTPYRPDSCSSSRSSHPLRGCANWCKLIPAPLQFADGVKLTDPRVVFHQQLHQPECSQRPTDSFRSRCQTGDPFLASHSTSVSYSFTQHQGKP